MLQAVGACAVAMLAARSEAERKNAARAFLAFCLYGSTHFLCQHIGDGQTQSRAAEAPRSRGIGLSECLKEPFLLFFADADSCIAHAEVQARKIALCVCLYG